jgi:hypothetical protein
LDVRRLAWRAGWEAAEHPRTRVRFDLVAAGWERRTGDSAAPDPA